MPEPSITPLARQLAEENGIDWQQVKGSGPGGAIEEEDILDYLVQVMAGDVSLPPDPNEPVSSGKLAGDLEQVQAAMAREGIDIQNLVPPLRGSTEATQDDLEFEVDFGGLEEEETPEAASWDNESYAPDEGSWFSEPAPTQTASGDSQQSQASWDVAASEETEPDITTDAETQELVELTATEPEVAPLSDESALTSDEPSWISDAGPAWAAEDELVMAELTTESSSEESTIASEEAPNEEESSWIGGDDVYFPEPEIDVGSSGEPTPPATFAPTPSPSPSPLGSASALLIPADFKGEAVPIFRQSVDLGAAQKAAHDLSQAWGEVVTPELFLFRASLQALANFEVPLRGVKGYFTTNTVQAYGVKPGGNLRETWNRLKSAHESGEGLWG